MINDFKENKNYKNLLIIGIGLIILVVIVLIIFSFTKNNPITKPIVNQRTFKGQIISDEIKIPNTIGISSNEGEIVPRGEYEVKLQPQSESEQVIISNAKLSIKGAYDPAQKIATVWSPDAKLIFIKSNGALGLDGLSSSWQLVFGSAQKQSGYEIIISADKIVSQKEIESKVYGYILPTNWYDSGDAISTISTLPQFEKETISALSFYYSEANKSWAYGLANGHKTTAMWVK